MDDNLEIPDFLNRKTNGLKPERGPAKVFAMAISPSSWERLEERRKEKSRGRVAKMLARKAERAAVAAGKVWDTERGGWR